MFGARILAPCSARLTRFLIQRPPAARTCFALNRGGGIMELSVIDGKIKEKKVLVVSKSYCPHCVKAKKVFADLLGEGVLKQDDYEVVEIDNDSNCEAIQSHMAEVTGGKSVPRVFIKGKFFGGGDDVVDAHKKGNLTKMIQA